MEAKKCSEQGCMLNAEVGLSPSGNYFCALHAENYKELPNVTHISEPISEIAREANLVKLMEEKSSKLLSELNSPKLEEEFRNTCSLLENDPSLHDMPSLVQAYMDYVQIYHQKTAIYNTVCKNNRTNLIIYNTENSSKEVKILDTPEPIDRYGTIVQLPSSKLFYFGTYSRAALIIDLKGEIQQLPPGPYCCSPSGIYFNDNIYCFGGYDGNTLTLSTRFDLVRNQWIDLTPMPQADSKCKSVIVNGNILISGYENRNLWLYSINLDSFTTIPYEFGRNKGKVLINAEERLYLIEFSDDGGFIYESEAASLYSWRRIANTPYDDDVFQVYCSYNKGAVYIGGFWDDYERHYKFNLKEKSLVNL